MGQEQLLLDAIRADPDQDENYLVYGDWLAEQGDPRGELIGFQHALARTPGDPTLAARVEQLVAAQLAALPRKIVATWRLGFIHRIELDANTAGLRELFAHPLLAALESISVVDRKEMFGEPRTTNHARMLEVILQHAPPALLRRLEIGSTASPLFETVGDLQRILARFPRVTELTLHTNAWPPGCVEVLAPIATAFELACPRMPSVRLREIAVASWPRLRRLALHLPTRKFDAKKVSPFAPMMNGRGFPGLVDLRVREHTRAGGLTERFCTEIVGSPLLPRLEVLDFTTIGLDVDVVRPSYPKLRHLKMLLPSAEDEVDVDAIQRLTYFLEEPDTERAIALSLRALTNARTAHDRHNINRRLGICLTLLSRLDEGLAAYDASLRDDPECSVTWMYKAWVLKRLGRLDEAAEALGQAVESRWHPANALRVEYLQVSLGIARGEPPPPVATIERLCETYATELQTMAVDADMHYELACLLAMLGRATESLAHLTECFDLCPPYRNWAVTEIDLASLRDDGPFRALIG